MVRIDKLTDYGMVLLTCMARSHAVDLRTARDLAVESGVPLPTVSRLLQSLLRGGLLVSHRGTKGGYALAKEPSEISIESVIAILDGPVALTVCSTGEAGSCDFEARCTIKNNQRVINDAIRGVLRQLTLADLMQPLELMTIKDAGGRAVPVVGHGPRRIQ